VLTEKTTTTKALARVTAMPHKGIVIVVVFALQGLPFHCRVFGWGRKIKVLDGFQNTGSA